MDNLIITTLEGLIQTLSSAFTLPSFTNFQFLMTGLLLRLGRPTVRNLIRAGNEESTHKHETAHHRFFSRAVWRADHLAQLVFQKIIVPWLCPTGAIEIAADDTTTAKSGRKVAFASWFRDAVASTGQATVKPWAHNWLLLCVVVRCPFVPTRYLHLPLLARLYRTQKQCDKQHPFRSKHEWLIEMLEVVLSWPAGRKLEVVADGAFASGSVVKKLLQGVSLVSRLRKDAKIFAEAPPRTGKPGRPKEKGQRLAKPEKLAETATFRKASVLRYGVVKEVLLYSCVVLWWEVSHQPVRLVIVRDPLGKEKDDYFFSTDLDLSAEIVAARYAARWGVEELLRELKQALGLAQVQSWSARAVERQVPFVMVAHSLVQASYFQALGEQSLVKGQVPSFSRMLTRIRMALWSRRISQYSSNSASNEKFLNLLEKALFTAA